MIQNAPQIVINPKYQPLIEDKNSRYFLVTGSRASSKSFSVSTLTINQLCEPGHRILYTRYTMSSAQISIIPEFREKIQLLGMDDDFYITNREITHKVTGSSILFSGIKESSGNQTGKLKSLTGVTTWILDEADELADEKTFQTIDDSVRIEGVQNRVILIFNPPLGEHWIYERFYDPFDITQEFNGTQQLYYSDRYNRGVTARYIHTTYEDNIDHLDIDTIIKIEGMKQSNYEKYLHIYRGWRMKKVEGALFDPEVISAHRVVSVPYLKQIAVAVDPKIKIVTKQDELSVAGLSGVELDRKLEQMGRDLTGIIVGGKSLDGHIYILDDRSKFSTAESWGQAAIAAYNDHKADVIVYESNQGGDLVERNISAINPDIPCVSVYARRGKQMRAEPVATLYQMGKVHHVGTLQALERQMTTWTDGDKKSPDRMDALVHLVSYLMGIATSTTQPVSPCVPRQGQSRPQSRPTISFGRSSNGRPPVFR